MDKKEIEQIIKLLKILERLISPNLKDSYLKLLTNYCEYIDALDTDDILVQVNKAREVFEMIISLSIQLSLETEYIFTTEVFSLKPDDEEDPDEYGDDEDEEDNEYMGEEETTPLLHSIAKWGHFLDKITTKQKEQLFSELTALVSFIREDLSAYASVSEILSISISEIATTYDKNIFLIKNINLN